MIDVNHASSERTSNPYFYLHLRSDVIRYVLSAHCHLNMCVFLCPEQVFVTDTECIAKANDGTVSSLLVVRSPRNRVSFIAAE